MKCVLASITLALAVIVVADVQASSDSPLSDSLTSAMLQLKKEIPAGIPDLDIPPMDPHPLPEMKESLKTEVADITISAENVVVSGLSTFDLRSVTVGDDDGSLEMELAFPALEIAGDYSMSGAILGFPFEGAMGAADAAVMDVAAFCRGAWEKAVDGGFVLKDLKTHFRIGSRLLQLQRFPAVDDIIEAVLKELADAAFAKYEPVIADHFNEMLMKGLGAALKLGNELKVYELPVNKVYEAGNANEFLDHMIAQARPAIASKDPLTLPDATKGFEKKILGIRVHGEAAIYDGFLAGIQTIHRTGDAEMTQSPDMTKLVISANLGMSNLHGHYRMHAKFMNLGPTGEVSLKVSMVSCQLRVSVDLSSGKPQATLEHFDINYIGKIDLYFDGLGPLDWLINPLGGWIINLVKHKIADAVEGPLRQIISSKMGDIDIPIGF